MGFTTARLVNPIQIGRLYCIYYVNTVFLGNYSTYPRTLFLSDFSITFSINLLTHRMTWGPSYSLIKFSSNKVLMSTWIISFKISLDAALAKLVSPNNVSRLLGRHLYKLTTSSSSQSSDSRCVDKIILSWRTDAIRHCKAIQNRSKSYEKKLCEKKKWKKKP